MFRNPFRNLDEKKLRRNSDVLKKQNDYHKIVNKRVYILMGITVAFFVVIAIRLMDIQLRQKEEYTQKLESYTSKKQVTSTPRGQMLDRNQKIVVSTVNSLNITYFPTKDITISKQWELAEKFAKQFDVSYDHLTLKDLQDAYITLHKNEAGKNDHANHLLTQEELKLNDDEIYRLKLERITKELLDKELSANDRRAWVVFQAMDVYSLTSHKRVILENVDEEKVAYLTEHKSDFPGFDVDFSAWKREYPYGNVFKDVLGQVSNNQQGLPVQLKDYYLAQGYEMNARVGRSGLEQQYEAILSGTSKVATIKYDKEGNTIFNETNFGKKGYDLQLSIDIELQKKIDEILKNVLEKHKNDTNRPDMKELFVSLMDPNTGDIYAMSGVQKNENQYLNYASGNYLYSYTPGSVVKGATVYMGLNEGLVKADTIVQDAPMFIKGTPPIQSYRNYGPVNAVKALEVSSNIYMVNIAIKLANSQYVPNAPLVIPNPSLTFQKMRQYYSKFGLGIKTGIDIPNEQLGFFGHEQTPAQLLFFSFGQYDSYTPIQLLQYVSTIANGGKRIQPRLVQGAYGVNSKSLVFTNDTQILSVLDNNNQAIKTVQEGFRACVTSGNCGGLINAAPNAIAAKTGTAEVYVNNHPSTNASLIGYWPYEKPKVSFVCSAPTSSNVQNLQPNICFSEIMPEVIKAYNTIVEKK